MSVDLDQTPRSLLISERSSFLDEKSRISSQVEQQHFNYKVRALACSHVSTDSSVSLALR